jgi:hypothetical protein
MTIDLLGRLSPGYVESVLKQLRESLVDGQDAGDLERQYWAIVRDSANHGTPTSPWEWETWIAMHQRIFVTALVEWITTSPKPKRKGNGK